MCISLSHYIYIYIYIGNNRKIKNKYVYIGQPEAADAGTLPEGGEGVHVPGANHHAHATE